MCICVYMCIYTYIERECLSIYKDNLDIEMTRSFEKSNEILAIYVMSSFGFLIFIIFNNDINKVEISRKVIPLEVIDLCINLEKTN